LNIVLNARFEFVNPLGDGFSWCLRVLVVSLAHCLLSTAYCLLPTATADFLWPALKCSSGTLTRRLHVRAQQAAPLHGEGSALEPSTKLFWTDERDASACGHVVLG
jgi:hypothetical protein